MYKGKNIKFVLTVFGVSLIVSYFSALGGPQPAMREPCLARGRRRCLHYRPSGSKRRGKAVTRQRVIFNVLWLKDVPTRRRSRERKGERKDTGATPPRPGPLPGKRAEPNAEGTRQKPQPICSRRPWLTGWAPTASWRVPSRPSVRPVASRPVTMRSRVPTRYMLAAPSVSIVPA